MFTHTYVFLNSFLFGFYFHGYCEAGEKIAPLGHEDVNQCKCDGCKNLDFFMRCHYSDYLEKEINVLFTRMYAYRE